MAKTGAAGPLTGWDLGGWTLDTLLGSGGMGSVYRATRDGEQAAIKVLSAQLAGDEELQKRFRREIMIAAGLRSGRVARLLDAETEGPVPWFATELIEGPTLEDVVVERGPLRGEELRAFAEGLARAVDDLAQAGVVHRDIKPSNVILTDWSPILLDFGVATTPHSTSLTATGIALGTPVWMSPEQLVGRPVEAPSDVFSWATTTAYAATGRHPFGAGDLEEIAHRIVRGGPNLEQVEPPLRRLLQRAMVKDPRARPRAIDLVHAATRLTSEAPEVEATSEMSPLPLREQAARHAVRHPVRQGARRAEPRVVAQHGGRRAGEHGPQPPYVGRRRADVPVDRPVDRPVERPVDRPLDRPVDRARERPGERPRPPRGRAAPPRLRRAPAQEGPSPEILRAMRRQAGEPTGIWEQLREPNILKVAVGGISLVLLVVVALLTL